MSGVFGSSDGGTSSDGSSSILGSLFGGGGTSDPSGGGSGLDLGSIFSNLSNSAFDSGSQAQTAQTVNDVTQAVDPTGSVAATNAITAGQGAPTTTQNQNPQGQGGGQGNSGQFAPQSAVNDLKKALTGLTQQQRSNPWQIGGPNTGPDARQLNRAASIPTGQAASAPAQSADAANSNNPPPNTPAGIDPAAATQAGLRSDAPANTGGGPQPAPANENVGGAGALPVPAQSAGPPTAPSGGGSGSAAGGGTSAIEGLPPPGDVRALAPPGSLSALATGGGNPLWRAAMAAGGMLTPTPAETGELTPGQRGMNYRPEDDQRASPTGDAQPQGIEDPEQRAGGPGQGATTTAPATGKPIKTVDPKTGKPVDPQTGAPLPTKKPGAAPNQVGPDGHGPIARDMSGMSHGVPMGLGQLAQMALPLLAMALGGIGGGGRGRHRIGGRFGHPGGFGGRNMGGHHFGGDRMWPYHHPQGGWRAFGHHPGGGWLPMHPGHAREFGLSPAAYAGGDGGNDLGSNPAVQSILSALGGGQGQGGQNQGQSGFGGRRGGGLQGGPPQGGPAGGDDAFRSSGLGSNPFVNTLVGQESRGGQNIVSQTDKDSRGLTAAQGGNQDEISQGYFQIQNHPGGTWQTYGRQAGIDLNKYPTPRSAPIEVQWQVAQRIPIGQWGGATQSVLRQRGFNYDPNTPMGQVAQQFGGVNIARPGRTNTGGSVAANPQGNPANANPYANTPAPTQIGPEGVAAQ